MAIVEICDSTYTHTPINSLDKMYLKHRFKNKIICEECLSAYLDESSKTLAWEIFNCIGNVNNRALLASSISDRSDSFSFTYEKDLNTKFMQYILPIKFKIHISFVNELLSSYDLETSLSTMPSNSNTYRIARATINPIVCDSSYPSFSLTLDIRETDNKENIADHICVYFENFVSSFFEVIPENTVQMLMDKKNSSEYSSNSANSASSPKCDICNTNISFESYEYNNKFYCLDCMYDKVVQLAVDNNLSDLVGLVSQANTTTYAITDTNGWKRNVIDKYITAMGSFGFRPHITHYIVK